MMAVRFVHLAGAAGVAASAISLDACSPAATNSWETGVADAGFAEGGGGGGATCRSCARAAGSRSAAASAARSAALTRGHAHLECLAAVAVGRDAGIAGPRVMSQRSDGAIVGDMIDYMSLQALSEFHFVVTPEGTVTQ
jgi:hypothetical protein